MKETLVEREDKINLLSDNIKREFQLHHDEMHKILISNSWKITRPLRELRRWVTSPRNQLRRYCNASIRYAKNIYKFLPFSAKTRAIHRNFFARYVPGILQNNNYVVPNKSFERSENNKLVSAADSDGEVRNFFDNLPTSGSPIISIIIPVFGKIDYTVRCLASISRHVPEVAFEVIVVDDCSLDETALVLGKVSGLRLIKNEQNLGFIRSCNEGARNANGKYIHFLNNDTEVTHGWLDELYQTFARFPGTGLVGSKLIYPDGRLQEAGCIVWRDGSAWNFGRFQNPDLPIYSYSREVDYCSAASILVPKLLFDELGGFDERYIPDRYEDSDLAMAIRDKGYRIIYQAMSKVVHYEGISVGTDDSASENVKLYRNDNFNKFFDRWKFHLVSHQENGIDVDRAKDRCATNRVLYLDLCTPTPDQDSGSIDAYNHMLLLREMGFQVTFIPVDNFLYMPDYTSDLQRMGVEVLYSPFITSVEEHLIEAGERYDLVFVSRPTTLELHIECIKKYCSRAKILFHTVDLHFLRMEREARLMNSARLLESAMAMKKLELSLILKTDMTTVVSSEELSLINEMAPQSNLRLLPYARFIHGTKKTFIQRKGIVFVGGFQHTPNVDAVIYFVEEVMPHLRKKLPGVCFYIVGSKPPEKVFELADNDVIIKGFVKDLDQLFDEMRVSVAPLRYGAGIKGKIGSAMAMGLPVIATSLAAEGMSLSHGENILIADEAAEFASAIFNLYQSEELWNKLSKGGLSYAHSSWGPEAAYVNLKNILNEMGISVQRKSRELTLFESHKFFNDKSEGKSQNIDCENNFDYAKKIKQELDIYKDQVNVHDLPQIFHYWSNKYLVPIFEDAGIGSTEEFFSSNLLISAKRTGCSVANFLSIGSGNCDLEISIAKQLVDSGFDNFSLECLELNPSMLARGKQRAEDYGVSEKMIFSEADFNRWKPQKQYTGIMANQSLHHVTELEHLFKQIKESLHNDGSFIISDMIGRNGHQRWPETLTVVNKYWAQISDDKKYNVLLKRFEAEYENWDCSKEGFEGIRAQDILPLLVQEFLCEKFVGFGGVVDIFIDRCFGHNFDPNSISDLEFIDRLHAEDESGLKSGVLKPTQMRSIFVKTLHTIPYYSRGISPEQAIRKP